MKELVEIQTRLKAPKNNEARDSNGRIIYKYRSCEDILESAKDLLKELKSTIIITDEVVLIVNRFYIKATATFTNEKNESVSCSAFAREPDQLATMNQSQVTGAASSYARKYALNGLLAIDDTKDADTLHDEQPAAQAPAPASQPAQGNGEMTPEEVFTGYAKPEIDQARTREDLTRVYNSFPLLQDKEYFMNALTARRKALGIKNSNEK